MKIKQIVSPYLYTIQEGYIELKGIQFSHYCPKCNICIDYKMNYIYDLKYCFNCGQKLDISEIELTPRPIKPIKIKLPNVSNGSNSIDLDEIMLESLKSKDFK